MGWKSTVEVTRQEALAQVLIALSNPELTNKKLASVLEYLVGDDVGYNYMIVEGNKKEL